MFRIRAKIGVGEDPPEYIGKWFFTIWATPLNEGPRDILEKDSLGTFGPWGTEAIAKKECDTAVRLVCETIERGVVGETSGMYYDLRTRLLRRWDTKDEH